MSFPVRGRTEEEGNKEDTQIKTLIFWKSHSDWFLHTCSSWCMNGSGVSRSFRMMSARPRVGLTQPSWFHSCVFYGLYLIINTASLKLFFCLYRPRLCLLCSIPPANPVRNAGDVDFPVCAPLPPHSPLCRGAHLQGTWGHGVRLHTHACTHTQTHTLWDTHDWAPITCCSLCLFFPPCSMKNRRLPIFSSCTYWCRSLENMLYADIFPACLFSWSIPIFFLPFSEATQGATNEKAISDCSLYKGLRKQASKYREAFQLKEQVQKGAGEMGERKMDR